MARHLGRVRDLGPHPNMVQPWKEPTCGALFKKILPPIHFSFLFPFFWGGVSPEQPEAPTATVQFRVNSDIYTRHRVMYDSWDLILGLPYKDTASGIKETSTY